MRLFLQLFLRSPHRYFIKFERCNRGNILILAALAAFVLVGAVGIAIDMSRAQSLKSRMQTALDAANLATGVAYINNCNITETVTQIAQTNCLTTVAQNSFNANFPAKYLESQPITVTPDLSQLSAGYINIKALTTQKTSVISIMGVLDVNVSVNSQVKVPLSTAIPTAPPQCGATAFTCTNDGTVSGKLGDPLGTTQYANGYSWTCTNASGTINCCEPGSTACPLGETGTGGQASCSANKIIQPVSASTCCVAETNIPEGNGACSSKAGTNNTSGTYSTTGTCICNANGTSSCTETTTYNCECNPPAGYTDTTACIAYTYACVVQSCNAAANALFGTSAFGSQCEYLQTTTTNTGTSGNGLALPAPPTLTPLYPLSPITIQVPSLGR